MLEPVGFLARREILSFRLLGFFLFFLFGQLALFAPGFFLASADWAPLWAPWNFLTDGFSGQLIRCFFLFLAICGLFLGWGKFGNWPACFLIYGLIASASVELYLAEAYWSYVGWMLLASVAYRGDIPAFRLLRWSAWLVLGISYTASGFGKLTFTDLWTSGHAIELFISVKFPLASAYFSQGLSGFARLLTWLILVFEIFALPLALFRLTRPLLLVLGVAMHSFILILSMSGELLAFSPAQHSANYIIFPLTMCSGMLLFYGFIAELTWAWPFASIRTWIHSIPAKFR